MIGFIGFGRMGGALAGGAVAAGVLKPSNIVVYDHGSRGRSSAKRLKTRWAVDAVDVVRRLDLIFLCVKPQRMREAVAGIAPAINASQLRKKCFVSIAAGVPIKRFEEWFGKGVPVFRVMPNTPALLRTGASAVSRGRFGTAAQERRIMKILSSVGSVVSVAEKKMDVVTAVSGSGPAYVFYLAEAMLAAARELGLDASIARMLVHQTLLGAGRMLVERPEPAEELRQQVTSPNGTTAAAIAVFDKRNLKRIVVEGVRQAARRSAQLSKL